MTVYFDTFCTARCKASMDIPNDTEDILGYIEENIDDAEIDEISFYGDIEAPDEYEIA